MIFTIINIMGTDGLARQGATMCYNQNIPGQDTKAADAVAVAPCVIVVNTFLIEHKDLFILHSQYHGCRWPGNAVIDFIVSVSSSDSVNTNISLSFKMNPAQQEMWILCLPYISIISTDYTRKCVLFLNQLFEMIIHGLWLLYSSTRS